MEERYKKIIAEIVGVDILTYRDNRERREGGQGLKSEIGLLPQIGEHRGSLSLDSKRVAQNK